MKNVFTPKENSEVRQNDIIVKHVNTSRFGTQSLRALGQKNMEQPAIKYKNQKHRFQKLRNIFRDISVGRGFATSQPVGIDPKFLSQINNKLKILK